MPGGGLTGPGDDSGPSSDHFRRFRARPIICDLNIVTLPQLRLLRYQNCVLRQDRCLFLQKTLSVLATEEMSAVETGQISSVETGHMSAVKTGQMSAVETRQMSFLARENICPVSAANICPVSTEDIYFFQEKTSILSQQKTGRLLAAGQIDVFC